MLNKFIYFGILEENKMIKKNSLIIIISCFITICFCSLSVLILGFNSIFDERNYDYSCKNEINKFYENLKSSEYQNAYEKVNSEYISFAEFKSKVAGLINFEEKEEKDVQVNSWTDTVITHQSFIHTYGNSYHVKLKMDGDEPNKCKIYEIKVGEYIDSGIKIF